MPPLTCQSVYPYIKLQFYEVYALQRSVSLKYLFKFIAFVHIRIIKYATLPQYLHPAYVTRMSVG